jgi:hypothetical protein
LSESGHSEPFLSSDYSRRNEDHTDLLTFSQSLQYAPHISAIPQTLHREVSPVTNLDGGSGHEVVPVPAWYNPPTFSRRVIRAGGTIWRITTGFMTPPLWASVISVVVAITQPLQHLFNGYLRPARGAITQAGNCAIPMTLVVLGAYFHMPAEQSAPPGSPSDSSADSQRTTLSRRLRSLIALHSDSRKGAIRLEAHPTRLEDRGEGRTIFVVILARMFVVPLLLLPVVVLGELQGSPGVFKE